MKHRFPLFVLSVLSCLFCPGLIPAVDGAPYVGPQQLVVETMVASPAGDRLLTWRVSSMNSGMDRHVVRFSVSGQDDVPVVTLALHEEEGTVERIARGEGDATQRGVDFFLIQPGSPVPADILPVMQKEAEKILRFEEKAGGRVFLRSYRVNVSEKSGEECVASGWLTAAQAGEATTFRAITVFDEKNSRVAFQLWAKDGDWWLYEETPFRRSRLVR